MRFALIENQAVANLIEAADADALPGKMLIPPLAITHISDRLKPDGTLPNEIWAWSKMTRERTRFTESDPPGGDYTLLAPPAYCAGWDDDADAWTVDGAKALADSKAAKKSAIDANTNRLIERDGLLYQGKHFAMTQGAKINWNSLAAMKDALPYPTAIITMDDQIFPIADQTALMQFLSAAMLFETTDQNSPAVSGRILRMQVEAATTVEAVNAIIDDRQ